MRGIVQVAVALWRFIYGVHRRRIRATSSGEGVPRYNQPTTPARRKFQGRVQLLSHFSDSDNNFFSDAYYAPTWAVLVFQAAIHLVRMPQASMRDPVPDLNATEAKSKLMNPSRLALSLVACVAAPWTMAQSAPPSSGLLITRTNSEQWEIRLISGSSQGEQFSGVIESDLPFTAMTGVALEGNDSAKLLTPTSLATTLSTRPGGPGGVNFSVSADAKLCIRDTGSSGVQLYLGEALDSAVPVTAPVALTSADACGAVATTSATTAATSAAIFSRKFHPGQYVVMAGDGDSQTLMDTAIKPGVVGIMKRYSWRSLETSQGVYQFGELKSDLTWAAAHGMQLIAMIEDKTFKDVKAGPAYLDSYEIRNNLGGYTLMRWSSVVVARFNALTKALGAQVDGNRNFEGIATQETALSMALSTAKAHGYTPEEYRDAYINILTTAGTNMPTSRVFWFMNFFPGHQDYIGVIASKVASHGVNMGGPDVWPDNKSLQSRTYPFYSQFAGKLPLFGQVEYVCYWEPHMTSGYTTKYWTMLELYNYAMTKLHVNYMFWVRITKSPGYNWTNALPVISAHPQLNAFP